MEFLSSLLSGGLIGAIGTVGTEIVGFFKDRQKNKHELAMLMAQKDLALTVGNSAIALEAYKSLEASYEADKAAYTGPVSFVDSVRGLTRPALTWLFVLTACGTAAWAIRKIGVGSFTTEQIAVFSIHSLFNMTGTCVAWWFGSRQFDKMRQTEGKNGKT